MSRLFVDRAALEAFIVRLDAGFNQRGRLYLIGETSQVFEGWRRWTERIQLTADVAPANRDFFDRVLSGVQAELDIDVLEESPAEVIPLPDNYAARARPVDLELARLQVYHFDPYSVAFLAIARGDEPDYHLVLTFLEHGWIRVDEMDTLLSGLLPRFTFQTIQQDPAEFRRRYKGLGQMWRAARPPTADRRKQGC